MSTLYGPLNLGLQPYTNTLRRFISCLSVFLAVFIIPGDPVRASRSGQLETLQTHDAAVLYERSLESPAQEIAGMYPAVRKELEFSLELPVDFRPSIILVSNETAFEQIVGNRLIVAYAVPEKMLMVIDYARSSRDPFSLRTIVKHELCHLLLHRHIQNLPRWLDEGVSQWVSGGFAELFSPNRASSLRWATISGGLFSLDDLDKGFPGDEPGLVLAYEQSRSIVEYIANRYGTNGVINILTALKNGTVMTDAVVVSLGITLPELEKDWQKSIRTFSTVLAFFVGNIYTIIFFLAALATVAGYVRYRIKKKRFMEAEEVDLEE